MVLTPARWAGAFSFLAVAGVLLVVSTALSGPIDWPVLIGLSLAAGGGVGAAVLIVQLGQYNERTSAVEYEEEVTEPPQPGQPRFALEVRGINAKVYTRIPAGPNPQALAALARDIVAGAPFAERTATAHGYSRAQWQRLRDAAVANHWAYWKDEKHPEQGLRLTAPGLLWIEELAAGRLLKE